MEKVMHIPGGVYNFGSETKKSMYEITKEFLALIGKDIEVLDAPARHNLWMSGEKARKYGIDFSLKKDASENPPKYIVFFKARDVDVMTAAFKEYTANDLKKTNKPSLRKRLAKAMETVRKHREKVKEKTKDRGLQVL